RIVDNNPDPRVPYYIYNQKTATAAPENCTEFRDGGFITIIFGSSGPCRDGSNSATYSLLGIYPVGGRYETNLGQTITALGPVNAGTGSVPHTFISYADRLYLEAELINAGLAPGTAKTTFSSALDASFGQVDYYIANYIKPGSAGAPQTVPALVGTTAVNTYKTNLLTAWDAATPARQLEYIMTEKWINRIENPVDSYTDYRRTKYPVMFAPAPEGTVTSVSDYSTPAKVTPVSNDRKYPWSLPFSTNEISLNSSSPPQKVPENYKVFWQP
ncbi:MAG: SusD/RagB family nutrient-binding outer membrane lipoprotein, partial [Sediminibacterium sp.]